MLLLPAALTHANALACLQMLQQALAAEVAELIEVDASALVRFDSSALAVLLECRRSCQARGQGLLLRGLAPRLASLVALYGVAELLLPAAGAEAA